MLHRAIDEAEHLEVVEDVTDGRDLPRAIAKFDPQWVIVSAPFRSHFHSWTRQYPTVRFIFLSPDENRIGLKWQVAYKEYADLSLHDFIQILEKDLQSA
jgi:hypothetical protein